VPLVELPIPAWLPLLAAQTPAFDWPVVLRSMGLLLLAAVLAGLVAEYLHLPKVTAYLLVGVLLGPQVLKAIPAENLHFFMPLERLAMSLVLFGMGCHFTLAHVRRILRPVLRLSAGELTFTFLLVFGGLFALYGYWFELGIVPALPYPWLSLTSTPSP